MLPWPRLAGRRAMLRWRLSIPSAPLLALSKDRLPLELRGVLLDRQLARLPLPVHRDLPLSPSYSTLSLLRVGGLIFAGCQGELLELLDLLLGGISDRSTLGGEVVAPPGRLLVERRPRWRASYVSLMVHVSLDIINPP